MQCVLDRTGPAGVRYVGSSKREAELRSEAEALGTAATGNPFNLVGMMTVPRIEMASSHLAATAAALAKPEALASVPALARLWSEASVRALWLIEPAISAREAVERVLTDWRREASDVGRLGLASSSRSRERLEEVIDEVATAAGVQPKPQTPSVLDLIRKYGAGRSDDRLHDQVASLYRRSSGVVHSSFAGWTASIMGRNATGGFEVENLRVLVSDVVTAVDLHSRAVEAWTELQEWSPSDLFEQTWRLSVSRVYLPFIELDVAARFLEGEEDASPGG